jgi:hypothetical protein
MNPRSIPKDRELQGGRRNVGSAVTAEAVLEDAAAWVRLELLDDEVRQAAGLHGSPEDGFR